MKLSSVINNKINSVGLFLLFIVDIIARMRKRRSAAPGKNNLENIHGWHIYYEFLIHILYQRVNRDRISLDEPRVKQRVQFKPPHDTS